MFTGLLFLFAVQSDEDLLKDPVKFLEFIGEEQGFEVTFVEVEEKSKKVYNF